MKKKKKTINKKYFIIFIIIGIILGFILGFEITKAISSKKTESEQGLSQINEIIEYNKNLTYTKTIYEHCSQMGNASEQFICIGNYLVENAEYIERDEIYSIDEMFEKGADCKTFSIYYATFADMLGYDYSFFYTPNHMSTLIDFGTGYCLLDGDKVNCFYYKETEF